MSSIAGCLACTNARGQRALAIPGVAGDDGILAVFLLVLNEEPGDPAVLLRLDVQLLPKIVSINMTDDNRPSLAHLRRPQQTGEAFFR